MKEIIIHLLIFPLSSRGFAILSSIFICLFPSAVPAYSENVENVALSLLVEIHSPDSGDNLELKDIVQSAIILEIERVGVFVNPVPGDAESPASIANKVYAAEITQKYGTSGILICYVTGEGDNLRFELMLQVPEIPSLSASTVKDGKFDLAVDKVISEAVADIINQVGDYLPIPGLNTESGRHKITEAVPEPESSLKTEPVPELIDEPEESDIGKPEQQSPDAGLNLLRISLGAAPFLAVGNVNYYFNFGIMSTLQAGYRLKTSIGSIDAGLSVGLLYFEALGLQSSSMNYLIPLGISGRWSPGIESNLDFFLSLAGGAAFFIMQIPDTEPLFKVTGFVSLGGGMEICFSNMFGISIDVDYILVYEEYYPIMGIVPSVYFDIRI